MQHLYYGKVCKSTKQVNNHNIQVMVRLARCVELNRMIHE